MPEPTQAGPGNGSESRRRRGVRRLLSTVWAWAIALVLMAPSGLAAQRMMMRMPDLDREARAAVANAVADLLEANYVLPDRAVEYAEWLREGAESDRWSDITDPNAFAQRLTAGLQGLNPDGHLNIIPPGDPNTPPPGRFDPRIQVPDGAEEWGMEVMAEAGGGSCESGGPGPRVMRRPPGESGGEGAAGPRVVRRMPGGGQAGGQPMSLEQMIEMRAAQEAHQNHFFRAVEVLPGNVGYLDLDQFPIPSEGAMAAADAALNFLRNVDALILDLRDNPGGAEGMNQYLNSHFFAADEPVELYARHYRPEDRTEVFESDPTVEGPIFADIPIYVLISGRSGSAAENMSNALRTTERATLIGEDTYGAGHSSTRVGLPYRFGMVLPFARAFDPRTGESFEGTGVPPHIAVDPDEALYRAQVEALTILAERADDPQERQSLEQALLLTQAEKRAAERGPGVPAAWRDYPGVYSNRTITLDDGVLRLQRTDVPGAPPLELIELEEDFFSLRELPSARVRFERNEAGEVVALSVRQPTGAWERSERTQ